MNPKEIKQVAQTSQRWWGAAPGLNRSQSLWLGRLYCLPQSTIPLPLQLGGIHWSPKFLFDCEIPVCFIKPLTSGDPLSRWLETWIDTDSAILHQWGNSSWVLHTAQMDFKFMTFKKNWDHSPKLCAQLQVGGGPPIHGHRTVSHLFLLLLRARN